MLRGRGIPSNSAAKEYLDSSLRYRSSPLRAFYFNDVEIIVNKRLLAPRIRTSRELAALIAIAHLLFYGFREFLNLRRRIDDVQ